MDKIKSCAIFGHDPMRFTWGFDEVADACREMKMELAQQIMVLRQQGVAQFSVACDYGVGLYAAEIINALQNDDSELMLFCITPYCRWRGPLCRSVPLPPVLRASAPSLSELLSAGIPLYGRPLPVLGDGADLPS